jgi:hypothetical protein
LATSPPVALPLVEVPPSAAVPGKTTWVPDHYIVSGDNHSLESVLETEPPSLPMFPPFEGPAFPEIALPPGPRLLPWPPSALPEKESPAVTSSSGPKLSKENVDKLVLSEYASR